MDAEFIALVSVLFFIVAALYSSVGHGGATGYIAVMGLLGISTDIIRPVALTLNIIVSGLATYRFSQAGFLDWRSVWPLLIASIPMAFIGGAIVLPPEIYRPILGVLLLLSAGYLIVQSIGRLEGLDSPHSRVPILGGLGSGGAIGLFSGLTGIGGGVLLSPLMLILKWTNVRKTSAIAAIFILFNSTAGLAGNLVSLQSIPSVLPIWSGSALLGAWVGTSFGLKLLPTRYLVWLLAGAVLVSGLKFLST